MNLISRKVNRSGLRISNSKVFSSVSLILGDPLRKGNVQFTMEPFYHRRVYISKMVFRLPENRISAKLNTVGVTFFVFLGKYRIFYVETVQGGFYKGIDSLPQTLIF